MTFETSSPRFSGQLSAVSVGIKFQVSGFRKGRQRTATTSQLLARKPFWFVILNEVKDLLLASSPGTGAEMRHTKVADASTLFWRICCVRVKPTF